MNASRLDRKSAVPVLSPCQTNALRTRSSKPLVPHQRHASGASDALNAVSLKIHATPPPTVIAAWVTRCLRSGDADATRAQTIRMISAFIFAQRSATEIAQKPSGLSPRRGASGTA
jgi:hypothetical protein